MSTTSQPKIVVHWLEHSRAQRILWLLEELELPYEVKLYKRGDDKLAPPELKQVHPLGRSPVITIQESSTSPVLTLAESGAICELLVERYGNGNESSKLTAPAVDADLKTRADYLFWLHFAEGSAMAPRFLHVVFATITKRVPFLAKTVWNPIASQVQETVIKPRTNANSDLLENALKGKQYLIGDQLTAADVMMSFVAEGLVASGDLSKYPATQSWFKGISARPAWKKAEERGGKTDLSLITK